MSAGTNTCCHRQYKHIEYKVSISHLIINIGLERVYCIHSIWLHFDGFLYIYNFVYGMWLSDDGCRLSIVALSFRPSVQGKGTVCCPIAFSFIVDCCFVRFVRFVAVFFLVFGDLISVKSAQSLHYALPAFLLNFVMWCDGMLFCVWLTSKMYRLSTISVKLCMLFILILMRACYVLIRMNGWL